MKQGCLLCERTAFDNNLYCQEIYCPAEMSPTILGCGEWLGNIEIVKPICVLRTAVLYEAIAQQTKVLLKVGHPGAEHRERLKREAQFLESIQRSKQTCEFLPTLRPPYANTTIERDPYGKIVLRGHLLYYCLFEHFEGDVLRDMLNKNPQLWVYHVGWIMLRLASAIAFLQHHGLYHFTLTPESLLVRMEEKPNVPYILLHDLGLVSNQADLSSSWYGLAVPPAYTASELLAPHVPQPNYATDVYGLGLILYELLVGEPAFPAKLSSDEVYAAIQRNQRVKMSRDEDVHVAAIIASTASQRVVSERYPHAAELVRILLAEFGPVPRRRKRLSLKHGLMAGAAVLAIGLIIFVAAWI